MKKLSLKLILKEFKPIRQTRVGQAPPGERRGRTIVGQAPPGVSEKQQQAIEKIKQMDSMPQEKKKQERVVPADPKTGMPSTSHSVTVFVKGGSPHREEGPAILPADAPEDATTYEGGEYYLFGKRYPGFYEWQKAVRQLQKIRSQYGLSQPQRPFMVDPRAETVPSVPSTTQPGTQVAKRSAKKR